MNKTLEKRILSFKYAFKGIFFFLKSETNAKIHCVIALFIIIFGFLLKISNTEWCLVILSIGFVLTIEAINTAIEKIIDFISPEYHKIAEIVKDVAAGSVLISAITAAIIGIIIFLPKIIQFFNF